jgi:hypothetical protein
VAACPAGVITGAHFNNQQIFAEIQGALWDALAPGGDGPQAAGSKAEAAAG